MKNTNKLKVLIDNYSRSKEELQQELNILQLSDPFNYVEKIKILNYHVSEDALKLAEEVIYLKELLLKE